MSTFVTRSAVLGAAAVVSALTFGLGLAHGAVRPTLGIAQGAEHWNYAVRPKNGPSRQAELPIIPGEPKARVEPDGFRSNGASHIGPDGKGPCGGKGHITPDALVFGA